MDFGKVNNLNDGEMITSHLMFEYVIEQLFYDKNMLHHKTISQWQN